MSSIIMAIFLIGIGFAAGWRYGYKQVTDDVKHVVDEVLNVSRRRPQ